MDRQTLNYVFSLPNPKQYWKNTVWHYSCASFLLNQCGCSIDHWWSADMDIVIYLSRSEMIIFFGSKFSDFCQRYGLFCMMERSAIFALMRGHLSQRPLFFRHPLGQYWFHQTPTENLSENQGKGWLSFL